MGKFAEFCKGKTMGAFFPLLLATGQVLGHYSFMSLRHDARKERSPRTHDAVRIDEQRLVYARQQLLQALSALQQPLLEEGSPLDEEQIEKHIRDCRPRCAGRQPQRRGPVALVPAQKGGVSPAVAQHDQFAIDHRARR